MGTAKPSKTSADELAAFERATQNLVGLALRSLENLEVSLPQFRLLLALHRAGTMTSSDCAKALGIGNSSVTRLADRLILSGYLVRGSDPAHRSIVTLELTELGRHTVDEVTARRRNDLQEALNLLSPTERSACAAALDHLHDVIDHGVAAPWTSHLPL